MIAYAFLAIFWSFAVLKLFQRKIGGKIVAVLLAIALSITGIYDFVVILKDNDSGHRVTVNMKSELTEWLAENLDAEAIKNLVKQEKITYILYEEGMQYEQEACREDTIASAFTLVYESEDGRIRIYET